MLFNQYYKIKRIGFKKGLRILTIGIFYFLGTLPAGAEIGDGFQLKIASWNIQNFGGKFGGNKKPRDPMFLNALVAVIDPTNPNAQNAVFPGNLNQSVPPLNPVPQNQGPFDIVFFQEIANVVPKIGCSTTDDQGRQIGSNEGRVLAPAFEALCDKLTGYYCKNTPIMNNDPNNCETYGVAYKMSLGDEDWVKVNWTGDPATVPHIPPVGNNEQGLKRPPMKATITLKNGKQITVFSVHTSPGGKSSQTVNVNSLSRMYFGAGGNDGVENFNTSNPGENIIALGDMNAGCNYLRYGFQKYNMGNQNPIFPDQTWTYVIGDDRRTNLAKGSTCAYDRIMLNRNLFYTYDQSCQMVTDIDDLLLQNQTNRQGVNQNWGNFNKAQISPTNRLKFAGNGSMCVVGVLSNINTNLNPQAHWNVFPFNSMQLSKTSALSDHKLVYVPLHFGAVGATDCKGNSAQGPNRVFYDCTQDSNCVQKENIYYDGNHFTPGTEFTAYYKYKTVDTDMGMKDGQSLTQDPSIYYIGKVQVDNQGNLQNSYSMDDPQIGYYNLIADVNNNGTYEKNVDVIDDQNRYGFTVQQCVAP